MHVTAQLKHCGYKFEHISYNREAYASGRLARELKENVKYHQCVLLYAKRIFLVFRAVVSAYIAMTSFAMAVIAYQIVQADRVQDSLRYTMLLLGWGSLFFLVCLQAQKVQDESVAISNSIYNSGWADDFFDSDIRRSIIITMRRAQKPVHLKISCLGIISLSRFITILKSAYSFFALLVTLTERTETPRAT
ncbi:unnamed protein product [Ceutorhynchus assimilis]|uniref:Uncharacterized protein n=1 Tax=Ceutorhynchus assimilis TaxID=467358 RepID=A0A9N9MSX4_9CUCU|nr:unnamed protein product [Ceutorhynchus assimilis]